jgi:hypothetical protein
VEKYAAVGSDLVCETAYAKEAAVAAMGEHKQDASGRGWSTAATDERHDENDDQRPDQIELLLDREGPEVLHERWRTSGLEVIRAGVGEVDVRGESQRPPDCADALTNPSAAESHLICHGGHGQDGKRGGQDAPSPTGVEALQRNPGSALGFPEQQPGDQVARDYEEDVDTDEATARPPAQMAGDHEQYGDRS